MLRGVFLASILLLGACSKTSQQDTNIKSCDVQFMILGTSQDAGTPQIGNSNDVAWKNNETKRLAASAALIDQRDGQRYLFEATPDIRQQLKELDDAFPVSNEHSLGISNIFITLAQYWALCWPYFFRARICGHQKYQRYGHAAFGQIFA